MRTLCFIAVWLCLFPLVYHLTGAPGAAQPATSLVQSSHMLPTWVRLRFAHPPSSALLISNGTNLYSLPHPIGLDSEFRIDLPISDSNALLELSVDWEDLDTKTVVELRLEPDGLSPRIFHFWAAQQCREKVRVAW